jgi:hypothetical protein
VRQHGPLPATCVLMLAAGVAEALQSVHAAGVIHRDLKPSNVLLASDGPRVIDFGIARAGDATALTGTDVRLGTPAYMSPEQAEGRTAGPGVDIFTLGLIVFHAATGAHPFGDGAGHALLYRIVSQDPDLAGCPEALRPIVAQCLAKDPGHRPALDEIIETCRRIAEAEGADLTRGEGWWLPQSLATEATRMETAPLPPLPPLPPDSPYAGTVAVGGFGPPPTRLDPPRTAMGGVPPGPSPASGPAPEDAAPARGRRGFLGGGRRSATALLVAAAAGAAIALIVSQTLGDGGSGGNGSGGGGAGGSSAGYTAKQHDVALTIPAPGYSDGTYFREGMCVDYDQIYDGVKSSVYVNLDTLTTASQQADAADPDVDKAYTLRYTDCSNSNGLDAGTSGGHGPTSGLKLLDNRGSWGLTKKQTISAADCERTARSGSLPDPVSIAQIQKGDVLRPGTGICVITRTGTVAFLWINAVHKHPDNDNLADLVTTATQWAPKK